MSKKIDQQTVNDVKVQEAKKKAAHKVGDAIERAGQKIQDLGATEIGKKVYNKGDKIEHSED